MKKPVFPWGYMAGKGQNQGSYVFVLTAQLNVSAQSPESWERIALRECRHTKMLSKIVSVLVELA